MNTGTRDAGLALATLLTVAAVEWTAACASAAELEVTDFRFDGEMGSLGAKIEKTGRNEFKIEVAPSPGYGPRSDGSWRNKVQFVIPRNAKGNSLKLTKYFRGKIIDKEVGIFKNVVWSYDKKNWMRIRWKKGVLEFPVFKQDTVYLYGTKPPMLPEWIAAMVDDWRKSPYVKVHVLGQSLLRKENIFRIEITDPRSPHPRGRRWVQYLASQHCDEHPSQWVMVGMINWLLGDEAAQVRKRFIFHFVLMMNPDGIACGFHRPNTQGVDTNRSYFVRGSDQATQSHEAYLCQKDLEKLMRSEAPVTAVWSMHNGGGTRIVGGRECGTLIGPIDELPEIIRRNDPKNELGAKWRVTGPGGGGSTTWNSGPQRQFNITAILYEGGARDKERVQKAGALLAKSIAEYWRGTRSAGGG